MIVKNSADTIRKTLTYARPLVSRWTILDTGSSDGTQDIIRSTMEELGLPGTLYEEPFVDFETTRNRAFQLATKQCTHYIVLDDTYLVQNAAAIQAYVAGRPGIKAFNLVVHTDQDFYYNTRITRVDSGLRYKYKVHETIDYPVERTVNIPKSVGYLFDNTNSTHTRRTLLRQERDYRHLLSDLERFPENAYVLFNLGRNRFNLKKYKEAAGYLQRCIYCKDLGGFGYDAALILASIYQKNKESSERIINMFKFAHELDPERIDALFHMATEYYGAQDFKEATRYVKKAWKLLQNTDNISGTLQMRNVEIPHLYIECCIQTSNFTKAQEILVQSLKDHPTEIRFQNTAYAVTPRNPSHTVHRLDAKLCVIHTGGKTVWNPATADKQSMVEVSAVKVAELLVSRGWKVMVFGPFVGADANYEAKANGVEYIDSSKYGDMAQKYFIDVLLVCNESNNLVYFDNIDQVYLWTHYPTPSSDGGMQLHKTKFKGLIVLSEWQRKMIQKVYPAPASMFVMSRYGINSKHYASEREKVAGRFIFSSMPNHGLERAVAIVEKVREWMPTATLKVLCNRDLLDDEQTTMLDSRKEWVTLEPSPSAARMALETLNAEWMLLPTSVEDAYYVQALEAMAAGCCVVASNLASLPNIVGNAGSLVPVDALNDVSVDDFVDRIKFLHTHPDIKATLCGRARDAAKDMSYGQEVDRLIRVFESNATKTE